MVSNVILEENFLSANKKLVNENIRKKDFTSILQIANSNSSMPYEGEYISKNTAQKIGENYNADYIFHVSLNDLSSNKRSVVVPYVNMERKKQRH